MVSLSNTCGTETVGWTFGLKLEVIVSSEHLKKCVGMKGGHLVCPELWVVWHLAGGLYSLNTFDKEGGCAIN